MNLLFLVHKGNPKFNPQKRASIAIDLDCDHGTGSILSTHAVLSSQRVHQRVCFPTLEESTED
jgi:hypothetical protein